ncbi:hypothetical protein [Candidatus Protochlamydia sp. W-9]|uniref:hypothetical protein n=1 Tax=Candidatus Protochlamydia sp. W-9 TaxID=1785087 RepID=UPI00096A4B63|nr:hypothetical protein [Candidatus Protochlamydia sp. W-9]
MGRLSLLFFYTLSLTLILPILLPHLPLLYFAPFLVIAIYKREKIDCLWLAFLCGLFVDLLSFQMRLGFYALNYMLTIELLYYFKRHFFEDGLYTVSILTSLFSILFVVIHVTLFFMFGHGLKLTGAWVKNDLIWMPICDGIYALLVFSLPSLFLPKRQVFRRNKVILQRENK